MAARQQILSRSTQQQAARISPVHGMSGAAAVHTYNSNQELQSSELNLFLAESHFFPSSGDRIEHGTIVENLYECVQEAMRIPGALACIQRLPSFQALQTLMAEKAADAHALTTHQIAKNVIEHSPIASEKSLVGTMLRELSEEPDAQSDEADPAETGVGGEEEAAPSRYKYAASKLRIVQSPISWQKISPESLQEYLALAAVGAVDRLRINITSVSRPAPGLLSLVRGSSDKAQLGRAPPAPVSASRYSKFEASKTEQASSELVSHSEAPHPLAAIVTVLATAILLATNMKKQGHVGLVDKIAAFTRKVCIWVIAHVHLFGPSA